MASSETVLMEAASSASDRPSSGASVPAFDLADFQIPPFPTTAGQLVSKLNEEEVNVPEIIQLIECEPTVFTKVLNLANSPLYGTSRPINTVGHAVVLLGLRSVSQLAIAVASGALFKTGASPCAIRQKTYRQSLAVATVARVVAKQTQQASADEAFLCGVIHDVGKLVLLSKSKSGYSDLLSKFSIDDSVIEEQNTFGTTHPELGKLCARNWGLPESINQAIGDHHQPPSQVNASLSGTLVAANVVARRWGIGFGADERTDSDVFGDLLSDESQVECEDQFAAIRDICCS